MIAKVKKGDNFRRLIDYLTKGSRGEVLQMTHLASPDPSSAAAEMALTASLSRRTERPVMHIILSYADNEKVTGDQMRLDVQELMKGLELEANQSLAIRHRDGAKEHLHIAVNRVGFDGKAVSDSNSYAKTEAVLRSIENRRGWSTVAGRNAPSPGTDLRYKGIRQSNDPRQFAVPANVRASLIGARSWKDLDRRLAQDRWRLEAIPRGKTYGALLIGPDGQRIGAGRVDRSATYGQLQRRFGRQPQDRRRTYAAQAGKIKTRRLARRLSFALRPLVFLASNQPLMMRRRSRSSMYRSRLL